ncbi:hemagglutinin repeat-containing protein [Xanthomonas sp. NCPPB 2654]|uniref:hemagglutinin repeat-containing protein n=1 Tax=unclassified Xanthomonas TaxID=2643310 RepID=UPI0021E0DB2E|nr:MULTISPECIES: hemagglutinin repeat-containing protein [unclassified Xanthomonas]MDL5364131.1 hemagglutinin repeat-containing protein [Xanthomonas sp. NCPPB 2654]UYC20875.1 hemagglutinin repeat-containing protein [Xanthomonas sp. CFBP 8443]
MDKDSVSLGTVVAERCKRAVAMLLCCTVTWTSLPLYAQVVPVANPGGQQPGQQVAANGVPVVDIVAPNARGVSHNRYSRFDVGANGLILNNSGNISKTELGGYVAGNDNLKNSGAATLILNEVTSSASRLQGYTEIAGARAQLVIANPNGISCDGCGFLNASRVTLATGTPQLGGDGALNGFGITGGVLSIGGNGLDAYNVDRLDLLSRQLSVDGSVWAKDLLASTGTQRIGYDGMLLELLPGSDGAAPSIGIDVAYLGGMYADRIRLIATEAGVGVVSRGTLAAQSGSLQIDSAGQLSLSGTTVARDEVDLRAAGALAQQGVLGSQQAGVRLRGTQLSLSGDTIASGLLDARASGAFVHSGRSSAGAISLFGSELDAGGTLYSSGSLSLDASGTLRSSGVAYAGGTAQLSAGGSWLQRAGTLQSGGALSVQAAQIDAAGVLDAGAGLRLQSDGDLRLSGLAQSVQDAALQAGGRVDNAGQLSAGGRVDVAAAAIGNAAGGMLSANGDVSLATPGALDNAGTVYAGRDLRIDAAAFANDGSSYAGRNADIATAAATRSRGSLVAGDALRVDAAQFASSGELGSQRGATTLHSRGDLALDGAVAAKGALTVQVAGALHQSGTLSAASAQLQAGGDASLDGTVKTDDALQLSADGQLRSSATLAIGGDAELTAQGALVQAGQIQSGGALRLRGADIDQSGVLDAGTALSLRSDNGMRLAGTLQARGDLELDSAATLQNQAQVVAGGDLAVTADDVDNAAGAALSAGGDATIASASALRNDGSVHADGALRLSAGSFAQSETGKSYGGASLDLAATDAVDNRGDLIGGGDVRIDAGSIASSGQLGSQRGQLALDSRGDLRLDGVVVAAGMLRAEALGDLQQHGSLQAQSATLLAGRDLGLSGALKSATTLDLQAQRALMLDGQAVAGTAQLRAAQIALGQNAVLQSTGATTLHGGSIDSRGALDAGTDLSLHSDSALTLAGVAQAGGDVALTAADALDNAAQVVAGRDLHLRAASATNRATGTLSALDTLDIGVGGLFDNAGTLYGKQALTLDVGSFQHSGRLYAGNALSLSSAGALDNRGDLIAKGDLRIDAGSFSNSGQLGSETGRIALSSQGDLRLGGSVVAAAALDASALGDLLQSGALQAQSVALHAGRDLSAAGSLDSATVLDLQAQRALALDGQARAAGDAQLRGGSIAVGANAVLQGAAAVTLDGAAIDSRGALAAGTDLALRSTGDIRLAGVVQTTRDIALDAAAALDNAAQITAGRDLSLHAASAGNAIAGSIAAQRALDVRIDGMLDNAGTLQSSQVLTLQLGSLQQSGHAYAGGTLALQATGAVDNRGDLIAKGALRVDADSFASRGQLGSETGQVDLKTRGDLLLDGTVAAATVLNANAGGDLRQAGTLDAQSLQLQSARDMALTGVVRAQQALQAHAARDLSIAGQIGGAQQVGLNAGGALTTGTAAVVQSAGAVTLSAARIDSQGTLDAGTTLALASGGELALGGVAQAGGDLSLDAVGALRNRAQVVAGNDLRVHADSLSNASGGVLSAQRDVALEIAGLLDNAGGLRARRQLQVDVGAMQQTGQAYGMQGLGVLASGAVDNRGDLIAGSALRVQAATLASSGQLGSESGDVALVSQGDLALDGTLAAAGAFSAQAGGTLSQSGALSATTALQLQAHGDLTIAGTLTASQVTLGSDAVLAQHGVVNGADIALQAQRIDNAGQTLSSGNLSLRAGDIAIGGVAAAGMRNDGSLGSSGTLDLHADNILSASGKLIAAGNLLAQATQLDLAGSTTRVGGDASLTASAGLDHRGADLLAGGSLTVQAGGALDNGSLNGVGGQMQATRLDLAAATLKNSGGALVQSGSGQARIAVTGAFDNGNGRLSSNGQNLVVSAASLSNNQGRIEHAGTGTATLTSGGAIANVGGRILTQGQLQLGANAGIDNQNGVIAAAGDATLTAASLSNVGGSVSARGLSTQLGGGALDNRSGLLQAAGGTLDVRAGSLDNRGGTLQSVASGGSGGDLRADIVHALNNDGGLIGASNDATVGAENLSNNAGTIQAGRDLALTARGQLDNHQGGRIGATRNLGVAVTGALLNSGGQLDSGNAMTLSGGRIDNSQGSIANNGGGLTQLTTGGELRNAGGSLGGRGSVVLNAGSVVNSDGQLVAGGDLTTNTNALDNQRGSVYAGNSVLLQRAGATLDNRGGKIKAEQAVRLTLQSLSNSGGQIGAGSTVGGAGDVVIDIVGFDGSGSILAQNLLDLTVRNDYTHRAGAAITSNGDFRLNVGGNLVNESVLKATRGLSVIANNIGNRAGATMQAGNTQLNVGGTIDNAGDISASNTLQLTAGSIYNTGSLVGGNVLVNTGTLVNGADLGGATDNVAYGSALIGATNGMTLLVRDQLLNRDAKIFSLGNIAIGAARDGNGTITARTGVVNNLSGSIEADGSILIAANQLNNQRRVVATAMSPLSAGERAAANQAMPEQELRNDAEPANYQGHNLGVFRTFDAQEREKVTAASAEGRIVAGGNIALSGSVTNTASTIAAAGALWINQRGVGGLADGMLAGNENVLNQALALRQKVNYTDTEYKAGTGPQGCTPPPGKMYCSIEDSEEQAGGTIGGNRVTVVGSGTFENSYIALAANMTGGQGVSINGATIHNGAVGSDGRSISGAALGATQGTALSRRSVQSANGAGSKTVQAQAGSAVDGATVNNRIAAASLSAIRIDDGQRALAGGTDASAANVQAQTTQTSLSVAGNGGQRQQIDPGTGQVPQVVGGIGAPLGSIALPIGGLYRLVGANGASVNALGRAANGLGGINANRSNGPGRRYLIETDPRFVDYDNFISSDYLLDKLGVDPEWTQTRLGDGFYEQRLVLDQITELTGRRYLGNYDDGVAQYRALLEAGVAAAGSLQLSVGVGLTSAQVAALTDDIVWMVEQEYQGQKVLVPVVYLSSKTALTLRSDGALLAGGNGDVSLNATAGLTNQGTISGANVSATAGNLLNQGRIAASGTVELQAKQDLLNLGGQIAGRDVLLSAGNDLRSASSGSPLDVRSGISADRNLLIGAGHDLTLAGATVQAGNSAALQAGNNVVMQPAVTRDERGRVSGGAATDLSVGNNLSLLAGNDLQLHGVTIAAGGNAALQAGHDLSLTPVTDANGKATVRTSIVTDGSLQLAAGNDITIRQAEVKAGGDLIAAAGHDLNVESVLGDSRTTTDHSREGKTKVTTTTTLQDLDQQALSAGGNLILSAGNDVNLVAAKLDAGKGLAVVAGNDINSTTLTTVDSSDTLETRKRFKQTTSTRDETVHGTEFSAGSDIALQAGHDVNLTAAQVYSDTGGVALAAGHDVNLLATQEQHDAEQDMQKKKKGFLSSKTTTTHDEWHDSYAVGTSLSGETVQIKAGHDIAVVGSTVLADGDVRLAAGNDVTIESAQDHSSEAHSSSQKKSGLTGGLSGGVASVGYGKSRSNSQDVMESTTQYASAVGSQDGSLIVSAGNRLTIAASDVAAGENLTLAAKDIALLARQDTVDTQSSQSSKSSGFSVGVTYDPGAAYRSARDSTTDNMPDSGSTMGKISRRAEGDMAGIAAATTPVVIQAGAHRSNDAQNDSTSDARVSQLSAGGNLTLLASDGSITTQGAQLSAEGNALLLASQNIVFDVAHNTESSGNASTGKGWGFANNTASPPFGNYNQKGDGNGQSDTITGTQLSVGGNASLTTTKGDIALTASNIAAQGDVAIRAAGDLTIQSGQDTVGNANTYNNKAIGTVIISDTERFAGYHTEDHRDDSAQVTQVASSVGSLGGSVSLAAGGAYTQSASNVVAAKDVDITAASIEVLTANDTHSASSQDDTLKFGVFARVKSPLIDLINNVDAARNSDGRLSAMQGMAAAANGYQTASAISSTAGGAGSGSLVSVEAGVGYATSTEQYKGSSQTSQGSTISGGGNVSLTTTQGDLHVVQGNLSAGNTLSLDSARDLVLEAGNSGSSEHSKGSNAGVEVGVGASVGAQFGVYVYAQASVGSHKSDAESTTWQNTQLAGQNISLTSQGDTTLRGAVAKADRIDVQTGGDLTIESLQDTANIQSKESGYGGRIQVSFGSAWDASGYASSAKASGNSSGVTEQSGLFAGEGGYHVTAGNVNLIGGAIASTNAGNSELTADSLTYTDLKNQMGYSAASGSISGGFGSTGNGQSSTGADGNTVGGQAKDIGNTIANGNYGQANTANFSGGVPMSESGKDTSTTRATLTEGKIVIGGKSTTAAATGINTDASKGNEVLDALPDVRKVLVEQQAMAAATGTVVQTSQQIGGDIAANAATKAADARAAYLKGLSNAQREAFAKLDPAAQQNLLLSQSAAYRDAYATEKQWGIGGDYSRALQAVTTALVGSVSGQAASQVAGNALAPYAAQLVGQTFDGNHGSDPNAAAQVLSHALLGAVLAEVNGTSGTGGALAGAGGELAAQWLTKELYGNDPRAIDSEGKFNPNLLPEEDKQTIVALSQAVGALVGGMAGESMNDAAVGGAIARNAVENNWLKEDEAALKKVAQAECTAANKLSCDIVDAINKLDEARDADYAANVALAGANMDSHGIPHTLGELDFYMEGYWKANGLGGQKDAIFTNGLVRTYPTFGQDLYDLLGSAPKLLPDLLLGKNTFVAVGILNQGLLNAGGETFAAWQDLVQPGQASNYFTGKPVEGADAWSARFLSAVGIVQTALTGGGSNVARAGMNAAGEVAETGTLAGATVPKETSKNLLGNADKMLPDAINGDGLSRRTARDVISEINSGNLPGTPIGGTGSPREMLPTSNPSAAAEGFAMEFFGGKVPSDAILMKDGAWRAQIPGGDTWVTYRPAGVASGKTKSTTATVEINRPDVNLVNGHKPLKLKFPLTGETGPGG